MTDATDETPWEGQALTDAYHFGQRCRELRDSCPYAPDVLRPLDYVVSALATELWDRFFSQAEIRAAFEGAIQNLVPYAAGEERRGDRY